MAPTSWGPMTALGAFALVVAAKVIMLALAIRGTKPHERPAIIRALAEMTRSWPSRPAKPDAEPPSPAVREDSPD